MSIWGTLNKNGIFCWTCVEKIFPQESYPYTLNNGRDVRICEECNNHY
jgi:hypothetical protein